VNEAWRAIMIAVVATILALASYLSLAALVGVVFVLVMAVAIGWPWLINLPTPRTSSLVLALCGFGAVVAVVIMNVEPLLKWLPAALAGAVVVVFLQQLLRRDGRPRLTEAVAGMVAGMLVLASAAGWVAAVRTAGAESLVVASAVGLAGASAAAALPVRGWFGGLLTLAAGSLAGGGVGMVMPLVSGRVGLLIGLVAGILIASLRSLFAHLPAAGQRPAVLASVTMPVAASGIAIYIIGRVLIG